MNVTRRQAGGDLADLARRAGPLLPALKRSRLRDLLPLLSSTELLVKRTDLLTTVILKGAAGGAQAQFACEVDGAALAAALAGAGFSEQ